MLSEGHEVIPHELTAEELSNSTKAADLLHTNVVMNNLKVVDAYTTTTGNSTGAMTLTCQTEDNKEVFVRTEVIYVDKESGTKLVEADVLNKTINVHGIVDKYNNEYQIRVFKLDDITFLD